MDSRSNLILGVVSIVLALVAGFAWIPLDTGSGIIEHARRQVVIGDAMAPTLAVIVVATGGLLLCVFERRSTTEATLSRQNLSFLAVAATVLLAGLVLMRWAGPVAVWILDGRAEGMDAYRPLRDTAPWKYIGYLAGGIVLIAVPIMLTERRRSWTALAIALLATSFLVLVYDVPFEDLLLPPNGDV